MHTLLLVFEFLGTTELLVIAVVALILFGPRKLPEIGRTVGKGLAEFKRASDDFKRTWEYEVELERRKPSLEADGEGRGDAGAPSGDLAPATATDDAAWVTAEESADGPALPGDGATTVARGSADEVGDAGFDADVDAWDGGAARAGGTRASHARGDEDEINAS